MVLLYLMAGAATLSGPRFEEVTAAVGIDPDHTADPISLASGAAFFDWDGDGNLDLFVGQELSTNVLMRSLGPPTWAFEDVSAAAGLDQLALGTQGVVATDFTGDGREDLLLLSTEPDIGVRLLVGRPDGRFVDETVSRVSAPRSAWIAAAHGDPDGDGDIDVVLLRWSLRDMPSHNDECLESQWFENRWGILTWRDSGLPALAGCGLAGAFTDIDDDGDVDYVQANDFGAFYTPSLVHRNDGLGPDGAWKFSTNIGAAIGLSVANFGMGISIGDVDGDLRRDVFITSIGEDALLRGLPGGGFEDVTDAWRAGGTLGVGGRRLKWGCVFVDVENDGDEDLVVMASGFRFSLRASNGPEPSVLLLNEGVPPFTDVSLAAGLASTSSDRAVVAADYDRDGRVDLLFAGRDATKLFRNVTETSGHWLRVRLAGTVSNARGVGAKIVATACGVQQMRELTGGGGPGATILPEAHFGFGACAGPVSLAVRWPSGYLQSVQVAGIDQVATVAEPAWITVSQSTVPADGKATVTVTCQPSQAGAVTWTTTAGALTPMTAGDGGVWTGTLTAPASAGEAVLGFAVGGTPLRVHRRVRFLPPEPVTWTLGPTTPLQPGITTVGARLETASGTPGIAVTGGDVSGLVAPPGLSGVVWATVTPAPAAKAIVLQATLDGEPYGAPTTAPVTPRVSAALSRFHLRRPNPGGSLPRGRGREPGGSFLLLVAPMATIGSLSPDRPAPDALTPTIVRNGAPIADAPQFYNYRGFFMTFLAESDLAAGTYSASMDGVLFERSAVFTGKASTAASVSVARSTFAFFDRHLHADGEDIVPMLIVLQDEHGQSLDKLSMPPLAVACDGCTVLPETFYELPMMHDFAYSVDVRVGDRVGPVTASLSLGGEPTGLKATVPALPPAPEVPELAKTLITLPSTDVAADGTTAVPVGIAPVNASETLAGSGLQLTLWSSGGTANPVQYLGYGHYQATVTAPAEPCTATLVVTSAVAPGQARQILRFTAKDGAVVETPCTGYVPPPEPGPEVEDAAEHGTGGAAEPIEDAGDCAMSPAPGGAWLWLTAIVAWAVCRRFTIHILRRKRLSSANDSRPALDPPA